MWIQFYFSLKNGTNVVKRTSDESYALKATIQFQARNEQEFQLRNEEEEEETEEGERESFSINHALGRWYRVY